MISIILPEGSIGPTPQWPTWTMITAPGINDTVSCLYYTQYEKYEVWLTHANSHSCEISIRGGFIKTPRLIYTQLCPDNDICYELMDVMPSRLLEVFL